jgi:WD40 repeat protein
MAKRKRRGNVDSADGVPVGEEVREFMEVGQEVVPGMRMRCMCRGHTGTIGRIAWSPCRRFIASPSEDKTSRTWDTE